GSSAQFGETYRSIIAINIAGAAILLLLIGGNLVRMFRDYRNRRTGSRLKARLVAAFIALVIVPMAVVYAYAVQFLNQGIDSYFDVQVEQGLGDALELSRAALDVRIRVNKQQTRRIAERLYAVPEDELYGRLSQLRSAAGALDLTVSAGSSRIVASTTAAPLDRLPQLPSDEIMLSIRRDGEFAVLEPEADGTYIVRTAVVLPGWFGRDRAVLQANYSLGNKIGPLTDSVQATESRYSELVYLREPLKNAFILTLSLVVLITLLLAVYGAIFFARRITSPVQNLVAGTRAVARGEFDRPLPAGDDDEIGYLVDSFNDMMNQLGTAREEARSSEAQVENERASLEAILSRLSSGVVAIENNLTIRTANAAASDILQCDFAGREGQSVLSLAADNPVLAQFMEKSGEFIKEGRTDWREQIALQIEGERRVLVAACTPLPGSYRTAPGYVIVFEDVTELLRAQRDAAWGEVARRLAHEIKNPLTPIKLSAERIRHKYLDHVPVDEADALDRSTQTIIRQVEAMRDMVNAFSEYARAPELNLVEIDINRLITNVADLYPSYEGGARLYLDLEDSLPLISADALRMRQVFHNLIRNSIEALEGKPDGKITISTSLQEKKSQTRCKITVRDNGPGFPTEHLDEIFEPYVSTKEKGSGLGLAIVRKLIEEHGGNVIIDNEAEDGATIRIYLPYNKNERDEL
ncbi:MAG: HAMP domain-containing protein, partial [Gammaproteobacteria bacterium]|nr:HAMP domain-containing protein [Gammaproteobacteria bacterium]